MSLPFDSEIEELMAEYRRRRDRTADLQRQIREISATATTPRQTVKVKVGAQGDLLGIEFPTGAYKRMAPAELTEAILAAVAEAKAKAMDALKELMTPELPPGLNIVDLLRGKAEPGGPPHGDPPMPDAVRDYIDTGLIPGRGTGGVDE